MVKIKDYNPKFYSNCKDFLLNNKKAIYKLLGKKFEKIYWVWEPEGGTWLKKFPVVVKAGDGYCALCSNRHSDFSIGWGFDFNGKINYPKEAGSQPVWKEYDTRAISRLKDKCIESVEIINFLPRFINEFPIYNKKEENIIRKLGFLHGVGLNINDKTMVVTNGLDDNNISFFDREFPSYYTRIIING